MTVRVLYFAGLREALGCSGEEFVLPAGAGRVAELRQALAARGEPWLQLNRTPNLRMAVNQVMCGNDAAVRDGDEVAFFPPVTGG